MMMMMMNNSYMHTRRLPRSQQTEDTKCKYICATLYTRHVRQPGALAMTSPCVTSRWSACCCYRSTELNYYLFNVLPHSEI